MDDFKTGISFGEIRKLSDDQDRLLYLKRRLECFLLNQVDEFADRSKSYSPFPLTVMTCVAVETLGRIISPVLKYLNDPDRKDEIPKLVSIPIYRMLDKELAHKIDKKFKSSMSQILPKSDLRKVNSYPELFHTNLRSTYIHGFRPKNVFLKADLESGWEFDDGALVINPYWLWKEYKRVFYECFDIILDAQKKDNPYRQNALDYFNHLINE